MRCLQCGKDVPLLKRLAGSEFCSDGHRREYQREYSQLALGRLMQSKPSETEKNPSEDERGASAAAAAKNGPPPAVAVNGAAPSDANLVSVAARTENRAAAPVPSEQKAESKRAPLSPPERARFQPPPVRFMPAVKPVVKDAPEPAIAMATRIQKPAPAALQMAVVITAEFERAFPSLTPDRPRHHASMSPAELAQASAVRLERRVEIADSAVHLVERKLELRDSVRATPRIDLDLGIAAPESLGAQDQSLSIPVMSGVAPEEAALWTAAHREFAGSVISLGDFATFQLSTTGFEELPFGDAQGAGTAAAAAGAAVASNAGAGGVVGLTVDTALLLEEVDEPRTGKAAEAFASPLADARGSVPATAEAPSGARLLQPLQVVVQGIAPGKTKPVQVFGAAHFSGGAVQVPQPSGLPMRPVMLLAPAGGEGAAAPVASGKKRKAEVRILRLATVKPSMPATKTASFAEPDLGLPELQLQSSQKTAAARLPKIAAAVAGAAILGIGIFWFLGKGSDTGTKQAVEASALGDQWITNFAADAKGQRKVSVLRSSMSLPAYRLDFESSIQIKGLGWVYRAQDSKNFYVSKIELQKAGLNPKYVIAHYAVINGVDQPRVEVPLQVAVPLGGHYKIRFDAVGERFTTWLRDQQVDQWSDGRLKTGGAGLYSEGAEQSTLHGDFLVTPLIKEK